MEINDEEGDVMSRRKPVKIGCDYLRGPGWEIVCKTREECERMKCDDPVLTRLGFHACVFEAPNYFRVSFGRR